MSTTQFRLSIGAKRQLTLPAELLEQLHVAERGELLVEVIGDHAVVTPMVSVPRAELPEELRRTFESRRGARPSDIPLAQFLDEMGYKETAERAAAAPRRLTLQERLASLTPNERAALQPAVEEIFASPAKGREAAASEAARVAELVVGRARAAVERAKAAAVRRPAGRAGRVADGTVGGEARDVPARGTVRRQPIGRVTAGQLERERERR